MKRRKWTQKEVSDWLKKHHAFIYFNPSDKNLFVRKYYGIRVPGERRRRA